MIKETTDFLNMLFNKCKGYIEVRAIDKEGKVKCLFFPIDSIEEITNKIFNNNYLKKNNIFFGVCPRSSKSGKEENIQQVPALYVDIDCKDEEEKQQSLNQLDSFPVKPSLIIDSGHGCHAYWLLNTPFEINSKDDKLYIKGVLKGLCEELKADHCYDLSRILRVPYTYNLKDSNNSLLVRIIRNNSERKYTLQDFEKYRVVIDDIEISDIGLEEVEVPKRFYEILEKDKKLKDTWEKNRPDLEDQTRSGYDMSLADQLMSYDFNDSEIAAIMKKSPSGKNKDTTIAYLKHTIGKARAYWKNRNKKPVVKSKGAVQKLSKNKFNPRPYSEQILSKYHLKYDGYKRFWIYNESGIWEYRAELILNSILRKKILGNNHYKRYCVDEIIADLKGLAYTQELPQEPEPHLIPFNNGIYDTKNDRYIEYSADYFFINKLPVNFNKKNRVCPTINRIFNELVAPKDVVTLYEIIAYCFYRAYPYPKLFFLYGSGGNGKTAFTKILNRVFGTENISLVSCNDLQYNHFASSQLFGKLCNISGEMEYSILKNTSILKQCCGEDLIRCERKFKEAFPFTNCAKMIFLTNQIPLTADRSQAFYRRILLLEFPNKFIIGKNANPLIIEKVPQEEIEGLAWKCLEVLKELIKKDFVFQRHENTEKIIVKYDRLSNPLEAFLEERVEKVYENYIPVNEFKAQFEEYLKVNKYNSWSSQKLNKAMQDIGYSQTIKYSERVWGNLKWK